MVYEVAFVVEDSQAWLLVRCGFGGGIGSASALEVAEGVEVVLESRAPERESKVGREIAQEPNMGGLAR